MPFQCVGSPPVSGHLSKIFGRPSLFCFAYKHFSIIVIRLFPLLFPLGWWQGCVGASFDHVWVVIVFCFCSKHFSIIVFCLLLWLFPGGRWPASVGASVGHIWLVIIFCLAIMHIAIIVFYLASELLPSSWWQGMSQVNFNHGYLVSRLPIGCQASAMQRLFTGQIFLLPGYVGTPVPKLSL